MRAPGARYFAPHGSSQFQPEVHFPVRQIWFPGGAAPGFFSAGYAGLLRRLKVLGGRKTLPGQVIKNPTRGTRYVEAGPNLSACIQSLSESDALVSSSVDAHTRAHHPQNFRRLRRAGGAAVLALISLVRCRPSCPTRRSPSQSVCRTTHRTSALLWCCLHLCCWVVPCQNFRRLRRAGEATAARADFVCPLSSRPPLSLPVCLPHLPTARPLCFGVARRLCCCGALPEFSAPAARWGGHCCSR